MGFLSKKTWVRIFLSHPVSSDNKKILISKIILALFFAFVDT